MSKKTFSLAPKPKLPTNEQIIAFEQGGSGHDAKKVISREITKRLSLDIPLSVHTRFKTACSATGTKMVSELQIFIEKRTQELEQQAGIIREQNAP
ncbi:unnamed protein product [Commensalibacter communis]|uniref:hypothetical protein n=1 Tax=Commensalibacter communis TaxID=2972786 RepID=UPI0022FF8A21|nr:hypothetical protein [Commensalibacter communis]CAI3959385.1 unnamed protein product [Commensalibacter communis]CAI3960178.1 unnamed protein product [Commensalibacter communis]CAI3960236.1 unnamed protein product [Commensalibacter communis]